MKASGKTCCVPLSVYVLCALAAFIFIISPVAATLALTDSSFSPKPPMVPAQSQHVSATIWILPSGPTTFTSSHALQLQTGLTNARWNSQVVVDGFPAAQQTAQGSAAFISGAVLSYPTHRDVVIVVNVSGTVPANASSPLMVMQIDEINTNGVIVPGNSITIAQPVTVTNETPVIPTVPPITPTRTTLPASSPTRAPGFSLLGGIGALCIVSVVTIGYYSRECNRKKK